MFNKKKIAEMDKSIVALINRTDEQIKKNDSLEVTNEFLIERVISLTIGDTIIKNCPFCSSSPKVVHYLVRESFYNISQTNFYFKLCCQNPDCKVHPETEPSTNLDRIIIHWNAWEVGKR